VGWSKYLAFLAILHDPEEGKQPDRDVGWSKYLAFSVFLHGMVKNTKILAILCDPEEGN
jgi:hypothetical protein